MAVTDPAPGDHKQDPGILEEQRDTNRQVSQGVEVAELCARHGDHAAGVGVRRAPPVTDMERGAGRLGVDEAEVSGKIARARRDICELDEEPIVTSRGPEVAGRRQIGAVAGTGSRASGRGYRRGLAAGSVLGRDTACAPG